MRFLLFIIISFFCFVGSSAQESNNLHKNYFEIGINSGSCGASYTGGVYGGAGMFFISFGRKSAIDFRAKENYIVSPAKEAGAITVTYRLFFTKGFYAGGGFAHNHETLYKDYINDPVRATIGSSKYIVHRSGIAIETGYDFKAVLKSSGFGMYPETNLCLAYLLLDSEPNPLITLSFGFRFGFKKIIELQ